MTDRPDDIRREIEERLARHADAHARQDLDTAPQLYTHDAVVRPANMGPVRGHAELRTFFANWCAAMMVKEVAYSTEELDVHGDTAYHIGAYTGVQQPHGQARTFDRGRLHDRWFLTQMYARFWNDLADHASA